MEPIINPLWFYLFNVIDNIKIFIALAFLIAASFCVYCVVEGNIKENKFFKIAIIISCISMLFLIFLPEKEVFYQMLVASYITPDNIAATGGAVQDIVDYIINSVNELLNQ